MIDWGAGPLSDRRVGATSLARIAVLSLVLGEIAPHVDDRGIPWLASRMNEAQTIALLSSVASGMMVFTGITFSLFFVMLQFGSTAYSPRLAAILARPRVLGRATGAFIGTFLYALMALRGVGALPGGATSALTVWVAFGWVFASVIMLMRLAEAVASLLQVNVLHLLGDTGRREAARVYAPDTGEPPPPLAPLGPPAQSVLHEGGPRYLLALDVAALVELAREAGAVVRVPLATGDPIATGAVLATVHGGRADERALRRAFQLGRDRVLEEDPKYALRLLADVGIRALAPGLQEPTTTVLALDQIESLLAVLAHLHLERAAVHDASGALRLVYEATTWEEFLELGLSEIQCYGAGSMQVERRLAAVLGLLLDRVPPSRRPAVERLAHRQRSAVSDHFPEPTTRALAGGCDRQGLGHAPITS